MSILDRFLWERYSAEIHAALGFVVVAVIGMVGLLVISAVLGAASLTPYGTRAGLLVIALSVAAAAAIWWRGKATARPIPSGPARRSATPSPGPTRQPTEARQQRDAVPTEPRSPRVTLAEYPARPQPQPAVPAFAGAGAGDVEGLKRAFDRAFRAGQVDAAERVLDRLEAIPEEARWARTNRRLLAQQSGKR